MSRTPTTFLALLALLLVLLFAACTSEPAGEVEPDPDSDPASDPEPEETGEAEADEELTELEADLVEIAEQVSVLRELPLLEDITSEVVDPERLAEIVTERSGEAEALERTAAAERVLIALRHLPEDADLVEIQETLLSATIVGLYDFEDSVAYISSDAEPLGPSASATAAHELLHALQDQHFDLTRIEDLPEEDGDAVLAFLSVVEGDAIVLEDEWSATYQSDEERAEAEDEQLAGAQEQVEQLRDAPPYVVESLIFPYVAGERFVTALINEGAYDAVDAALEDPPTTTLEILDPDQYLAGDLTPRSLEAGSPPGAGWQPLFSSSFGAFDLLALFGSSASAEAAQGSTAWPAWRGGAIEAWEQDDETSVAVGWAFEDEERTDIVCDAIPAWYEDVAGGSAEDGGIWRGDRDVLALDCRDQEVRFALAPDADTARATLQTE